MPNRIFYILDVFAQEKYAGNQLAVIADAAKLSIKEMQQIANEMHFSETTFILSDQERNGGFDVRIFTPMTEVPFAGHPTLGTAYVIRQFIGPKKTNKVVLNLKVGQIPVVFEENSNGKEILWMTQAVPTFGKTFTIAQFAPILGIEALDFESKFPIQEVSTGLPFIVVALKTLDAVERAKVNLEARLKLLKENPSGILVFCPQSCNPENDLHARVFVDAFGVPEDPATGSGNGCLAAYLLEYKYYGGQEVDVRVEQGYEIDRPSLLRLKAQSENGNIRVQVGGQVLLVAKGELV
jgi:trans-2,3-dihydro-3-hydroxyanthranilate isomerase